MKRKFKFATEPSTLHTVVHVMLSCHLQVWRDKKINGNDFMMEESLNHSKEYISLKLAEIDTVRCSHDHAVDTRGWKD